MYSESGHRADEDEQDSYSEDDLGPSRAASRVHSRATSVAPSRAHSRDSMGSGAKTPQGGTRQEQALVDVPNRSRTTSTSQAPAPSKASVFPSVSAISSASVYSERTREVEVERTFTSTSRVTSSVTHVEHDRRVSSSTAKVATSLSSSEEKRGRESEKVRAKEKERLERERREREKELEREREREREREQREREEKERREWERTQKEREEKERRERERTQKEREERERREREQEQRERQEQERQEREREQRETEERQRKEREKEGKERKEREKAKAKTPKGASKHNSPIDLADSVVGKSPGPLADTLTSVWGSQSKAVTPSASPWPSAKSIDPSTPKTEQHPSSESRRLTPRNAEVKLSTPVTPALGEAEQALPIPVVAEDPPKRLSVQLPHFRDLAGTEAPGQTPADSLPPEQIPLGSAPEEVVEDTQTFEQAGEFSNENIEQAEAPLFGQSKDGLFSSWGNITNSISNGLTNMTSTAADGWTHIDPQSKQGAPAAETTSAKSSPSLGWGVSSLKPAKNKWNLGTTSFGNSFGGSLGGFGNLLGGDDHTRETAASETLDGDGGEVPLENVDSGFDDVSFGGDPSNVTEPAAEQAVVATGAENSAAPPGETWGDSPAEIYGQQPTTVSESQVEFGETPNADTEDKGVEDAGEGGGNDGQVAGDEEVAEEGEGRTTGKKKKNKGGGGNDAPQIEKTKSGDGKKKKKKK